MIDFYRLKIVETLQFHEIQPINSKTYPLSIPLQITLKILKYKDHALGKLIISIPLINRFLKDAIDK